MPGGGSGPYGGLPITGSPLLAIALGALTLLAAGTALLRTTRRKRS